jgi:hypothetical protein
MIVTWSHKNNYPYIHAKCHKIVPWFDEILYSHIQIVNISKISWFVITIMCMEHCKIEKLGSLS